VEVMWPKLSGGFEFHHHSCSCSGVALCTACEGACTKGCLHGSLEVFAHLKLRAGAGYPVAIRAGTISVTALNRLLCPRALLWQVLPVGKSDGFMGTRNAPDFLGTAVSWLMMSSVRGFSYGWRVFKVPLRVSGPYMIVQTGRSFTSLHTGGIFLLYLARKL